VQDVIDKIKTAEHRAETAEKQLHEHLKEANALITRVAVLESRYTDLKTTLDNVVVTQAQQGERLTGISTELQGVTSRLDGMRADFVDRMASVREDVKTVTNRVWSGSAAGAGGTGAIAFAIWFITQRGG
jgi:predicted nuclease with TOPRIM domain